MLKTKTMILTTAAVAVLAGCGGGGGGASSDPSTGNVPQAGGGTPTTAAVAADPMDASGYVHTGTSVVPQPPPVKRTLTTGVQLQMKSGVVVLPKRFEDNILSADDAKIVVSVNAGAALAVGRTYVTDMRAFKILAMSFDGQKVANVLIIMPVQPEDLVNIFEVAITSSASSTTSLAASRAHALAASTSVQCPASLFEMVTSGGLLECSLTNVAEWVDLAGTSPKKFSEEAKDGGAATDGELTAKVRYAPDVYFRLSPLETYKLKFEGKTTFEWDTAMKAEVTGTLSKDIPFVESEIPLSRLPWLRVLGLRAIAKGAFPISAAGKGNIDFTQQGGVVLDMGKYENSAWTRSQSIRTLPVQSKTGDPYVKNSTVTQKVVLKAGMAVEVELSTAYISGITAPLRAEMGAQMTIEPKPKNTYCATVSPYASLEAKVNVATSTEAMPKASAEWGDEDFKTARFGTCDGPTVTVNLKSVEPAAAGKVITVAAKNDIRPADQELPSAATPTPVKRPIPAANTTFTLGKASCTAAVQANGVASCQLTVPATGATEVVAVTKIEDIDVSASDRKAFELLATLTCPTAKPEDVWMDKRLGCLTVGSKFIDLSAGFTESVYRDTSYTLNERAYDTSFNNILGSIGDPTRYWANFLCVRNAPVTPNGNGYTLGLATDMSIAMGINNFGSKKPQGISAVTMGLYSGAQSGVTPVKPETCSPLIHPVIVNYTTGKIESVNPGALGAMKMYTLNY